MVSKTSGFCLIEDMPDSACICRWSTLPLGTRGTVCISFYYHMYGSDIGSLSVFAFFTGRRHYLWTRSGSISRHWVLATITMSVSDLQTTVMSLGQNDLCLANLDGRDPSLLIECNAQGNTSMLRTHCVGTCNMKVM